MDVDFYTAFFGIFLELLSVEQNAPLNQKGDVATVSSTGPSSQGITPSSRSTSGTRVDPVASPLPLSSLQEDRREATFYSRPTPEVVYARSDSFYDDDETASSSKSRTAARQKGKGPHNEKAQGDQPMPMDHSPLVPVSGNTRNHNWNSRSGASHKTNSSGKSNSIQDALDVATEATASERDSFPTVKAVTTARIAPSENEDRPDTNSAPVSAGAPPPPPLDSRLLERKFRNPVYEKMGPGVRKKHSLCLMSFQKNYLRLKQSSKKPAKTQHQIQLCLNLV